MAVAPGERTTAGLGYSPGCGPTVRIADPEVAAPAHTKRGSPGSGTERGVFFRPSRSSLWLNCSYRRGAAAPAASKEEPMEVGCESGDDGAGSIAECDTEARGAGDAHTR